MGMGFGQRQKHLSTVLGKQAIVSSKMRVNDSLGLAIPTGQSTLDQPVWITVCDLEAGYADSPVRDSLLRLVFSPPRVMGQNSSIFPKSLRCFWKPFLIAPAFWNLMAEEEALMPLGCLAKESQLWRRVPRRPLRSRTAEAR